jgi:hypothetical protein
MRDLVHRDAARKSADGTPFGKGHNRQRGFQQMRDDFQWQLLADPRLHRADVKIGVAVSLLLNRDDYEEEGRLHAWPGLNTIAEKTATNPRSVRRSIKRLELMGHFRIIKGGKGPGDPHHYVPVLKDAGWPMDTTQ